MADITQAGAPSKYTVGKVGDVYTDSITGKRYECVGVFHVSTYHGPETTYEWDEIITEGSGSGGSDGHTHSNKHVLDKLSQNSDGNLLFGGSEIQGSGSGEPGADGADGKSAYDIAVDHGFEGDEAAWLESLKGEPGADGKDGVDGQPGKDGAAGKDGVDGNDGKDGIDGITPSIGANGNWFLGDTDTGVAAAGKDGVDGITPSIGANGNWFLGDTDTGVVAAGKDGADGNPGADGKDGVDGNDGVGISKIEKIGTVDLVDTYRITFTDNTTFEYDVTNGADGVAGEGGSSEVPDGVTYVNLSESEDIGDIEEGVDADRLGGRLPEYYAKAEDVSAITKYQKYVNTELDSCFCEITANYAPVAGEYVPFVKTSGTFEVNNGRVIVKPGQRVQINITLSYNNPNDGTSGNIPYIIHDHTNDIVIKEFYPLHHSSYMQEFNFSATCQYTNSTNADCEIGLRVDDVYHPDIIDRRYASMTVQEIGRAITIDPLNYVNEKQGIEDAPVGHIISFMGNNAPDHYLSCDGTEYNIADYPYLAQHMIDQFGSVNHFGGDGSATFAVPDLRGEFLRGTGTALRNTGTGGAVGEHQDPTQHVFIDPGDGVSWVSGGAGISSYNPDTITGNVTMKSTSSGTSGGTYEQYFTSRPTNTAVLYCIKYEPTYFMVHKDYNTNYLQPTLYSEEERVVGCWINGKPLYEKSYHGLSLSVNSNSWTNLFSVSDLNVDELVVGKAKRATYEGYNGNILICVENGYAVGGAISGSHAVTSITIQYTKNTDAEGSFTTQMIKDYAVAGYNNTVFPDYTNEIAKITTAGATYTATENCVITGMVQISNTNAAEIYIDGVPVAGIHTRTADNWVDVMVYMKAGQTLTTRANNGVYNLTIYGLQS